MGAHPLGTDQPAVEGGERVAHPRRARGHRDPVGAGELVARGRHAPAGETVGDMALVVAQERDGEPLVAEDGGGGRAQVVDADQKRRRFTVRRNGAHGGHGHTRAPGPALGGDDADGLGRARHALDESIAQRQVHAGIRDAM